MRAIRRAASMVLVILILFSMTDGVYAAKGGKKPPKDDDPVAEQVLLLSDVTPLPDALESGETWAFDVVVNYTGKYEIRTSYESTVYPGESNEPFVQSLAYTAGTVSESINITLYDTSKRRAKLVESLELEINVINNVPENNAPYFVDPNDQTNIIHTLTLIGTEDIATYFEILALDMDGDTLVYSTDSDKLTLNGTSVTYTPDPNFNGLDTFKIYVSDGLLSSELSVTIDIEAVNDPPVLSDIGQIEILENEILQFEVTASDVDDDVLIYGVGTASNGTVSIDSLSGVLTYIPNQDYVGMDSFNVVVSDAEGLTDNQLVTVKMNAESSPYVYLSLGDSISAGISYENSLSQKIIESYSDKMYNHLSTLYDEVIYYDTSASGWNMIDMYVYVNDQSNEAMIQSADLITLCIGANDIMDAAPETSTGRDFYNVNWAIADGGLDAIEMYWDDIVNRIYALNPDVELLVMNMYNPYKIADNKENETAHILYPDHSMHDLVDLYFYSTEDLDGDQSIDYGLNYIIEQPEMVYENFNHTYHLVDVYSAFEAYQSNKGEIVAFYDNIVFFFNVQDPHPTRVGQTLIFDLHVMMLN